MKFIVNGLPDDFGARQATYEMTTLLDRIMLTLEGFIAGLKVTSVEQIEDAETEVMKRGEAIVYYVVNAVHDDRKEFRPIIIQELRESSDAILDEM